MNKTIADFTSANAKMKAKENEQSDLLDGMKRENAQLKKELQESKKKISTADKEHRGREVRLARALEECDKFKSVLSNATKETKNAGGDFRKEKDKLLQQVRSLERQRGELLQAFKKQMKLVDVLKRQKVHVEAAKLLEFTEEEFVKVLEWGN